MNGIQISRHVFSVDDTIRTDFTEGGISKLYTIDGAIHTAALHTQYTTSFGYVAFVERDVYIRCHGILINHIVATLTVVVEVHVIKLDRSRIFCGCHFFGLEVRLCPTGGAPEDNCIYRCGNAEFSVRSKVLPAGKTSTTSPCCSARTASISSPSFRLAMLYPSGKSSVVSNLQFPLNF